MTKEKAEKLSLLFTFHIPIKLIKNCGKISAYDTPEIFSQKINKRRSNDSFHRKEYNSPDSKLLH